MIRGLEIDPSVADGPQSCVLEQVTNGLAVRMALLYHLMGGAPADAPHPAATRVQVQFRIRSVIQVREGKLECC